MGYHLQGCKDNDRGGKGNVGEQEAASPRKEETKSARTERRQAAEREEAQETRWLKSKVRDFLIFLKKKKVQLIINRGVYEKSCEKLVIEITRDCAA